MADSSTGGYLIPTTGPIYDDLLDDFFGDLFAALTGLDRDNFIRPLFQVNPPPIPEADVDWLAFGVAVTEAEAGTAFLKVNDDDDLGSVLTRHEKIEVSLQIYGFNRYNISSLIRDGLELGQNNDQLYFNEIAYTGNMSPVINLTENVNGIYYKRGDTKITFMRQVDRKYPVLSFEEIQFEIIKES
jgi:hypothetical protein